MATFASLPLGQRIPASVHGVSCSLPTMAAVRGYEERDPEVLRQLTSGYPRFVLHPYVRQLTAQFTAELELAEHDLWLTCSSRMADELAIELGGAHVIRIRHDGLHGVAHSRSPELHTRARVYLQNLGGFLSSREAEDHLVRRQILPARSEEAAAEPGEALNLVLDALCQAYPGVERRDIALAPSGMNAFHAAWRTTADLQAARNRTVWIQMGWLYLDTIAVLKRFATRPGDYVYLPDVTNLDALRAACAAAGDRLAGLVTEAPTNPLVQTADLPAVADLVRGHGGRMIVDPTLLSPLNLAVLPYADVVVNSLTKYAASEGDVIAGASIINPRGPDADYLRGAVARRADPVYRRDLNRLAAQVADYESVIEQGNATTQRVVEFLERHPAVKRVYWSLQETTAANYLKLARSPGHIGSLVSFTLHRPLEAFYDRLRLAKGPSFGMKTSLICPYIYLAHYDLVTRPEGRAQLAASGLDPELLRLSVGCEPADEILAVLAEALD